MKGNIMRERVVMVGDELPLVGILCEPEKDQGKAPGTAVILLNSGVIHRVGSCRLSVTLGRALVERAGITTFRFLHSSCIFPKSKRHHQRIVMIQEGE